MKHLLPGKNDFSAKNLVVAITTQSIKADSVMKLHTNWRNKKMYQKNLERKAVNFKLCALARDESTDTTDMAQLVIFIRGTDNEYNVTEEMASLVPLKDTTKSLDLYEAVKITLKWFSLTFVNISGIATDGALVMNGKKEGLKKLIEDDAIASDHIWWNITASHIKKTQVRKL